MKLKNNEFELLSEKEVEETYKINTRTLQRERSIGTGIPYVKLGKRVRYKKGDVEKYIIKNTIGNYQYD